MIRIALLALCCLALVPASAKELLLPDKIWRVPEGNDFADPESEFSFARSVQSENVAIFWSREYGEDPRENTDKRKRFDPKRMLSECERYYEYYVDELKLVEKGNSISDKYKLVMIVFGGDEGTAFGGGIENMVGALWAPAVRVSREPFGILGHEMAHSFQFMARIDDGPGMPGSINEMAAQYTLWHVLPEWMTFENYHLGGFMKKTHYAFLHPTNMYHSPYVLEYWSQKRGKPFHGRMMRGARRSEDPVQTYQRLTSVTQEEFNDEMFDACRRFITWDLKRVEEVAKPYANQHQCTLVGADDGWLRIAPDNCPQNYGYNGIKLQVPKPGTKVALEFKGIAGAKGYNEVKTDKAGWRYGFLASLADGERVYGEIGREAEGSLAFEVPANTEFLWLVVMGAPAEHWPVAGRRRQADAPAEEAWPYQIRLVDTSVDAEFVK